jgi:drug/metabolite transporter (DMT)-like permease
MLALLAGNLCLACGPLFVRLADVGPVASAFWRIAIAVPLLFLLAHRFSGRAALRLPNGLFFVLLLSGLFFAADLAAFHLGILRTKMANANLFGNSATFFLPLYAFAMARAWPSRTQALALAIAGLGTLLLLGRSMELSRAYLVGDLFCILAGLLYTFYLVMMTRARGQMDTWPTLAWSTLMTAAPLLLCAMALGERLAPTDWTPLILLALVSQVAGQGFMTYALDRVSPLFFALMLLVQPIIAALIGWARFGEALTLIDGLGAALICLALVLVRLPARGAALKEAA